MFAMTTETHDQQTALREKIDHTRETASQAYHDAKDKAATALHTSKDKAGELAHKTARSIESNPLGILVGGLVVGVIAGALIPRSAREKELLTPLGKKLGETIRQATQAARETGLRELEEAGLTKDAAKDRAKSLFDDVVKAASNAGSAAAKAATNKTSV
ncbi:hypothetical protein JYA60_12300 [Sphingomonas yabuuchiae]|uniref:DUF883 domain-containing protein n=2 Tax=Sphingomonas yabuuchiae TaxID=172044 RepID=A0AA40ZZQ8_9SPHN|nr:hypothetical protein [Sphingomonas yabuuchiae]